MIIARNLTKTFKTSPKSLSAVHNVNLQILPGQTLGLIGASGCGKSTLGKLLLRLIEPTSGEIFFDGMDLLSLSPASLKAWRRQAQIIFQDPYASLNPRMKVRDILKEPLIIHNLPRSNDLILQALQDVHLSPDSLTKYPHEFSGGQRQRIGIARALILKPRFIVCDEPTSSLDISTQIQIIQLLKNLQKKFNLGYLFISHDLRTVQKIADKICVMHQGQIVEEGVPSQIFSDPKHPYTHELISAIPLRAT
jgi:oligopeptide transport system ATP-binding protein